MLSQDSTPETSFSLQNCPSISYQGQTYYRLGWCTNPQSWYWLQVPDLGSSSISYYLGTSLSSVLVPFFVIRVLRIFYFSGTVWFSLTPYLQSFSLLCSIHDLCDVICTGFLISDILIKFPLYSILDR